MTVEQNMSFGLRMAGMPRPEIARRVARAAEILRLGELLKRRPSELSGGQRQRVAIGRALVRDVDIFLFDEPLSNLDAKLRTELRVEIKKLHQELANTVIYVTHDQVEAMTLADRIAVMRNGRIEQLASPEIIYTRPVNRFVAGFVGSPGMNFLPATLTTATSASGADVEADLTGFDFTAPPPPGRPVEIGVRPEHLRLGPAARNLPIQARFAVEVVENMGADRYAWGRIGASPAATRVPADLALAPGAIIAAGAPLDTASLFDAESGVRL
jgi:multiple sugar transport system ATP-binding protein